MRTKHLKKSPVCKKLGSDQLQNWHKIIGMCNAVVHGYLNLDARLLAWVIEAKQYQSLLEFVDEFVKDFGGEA